MQYLAIFSSACLLAVASAQSATFTCPADTNKNTTIQVDAKTYSYNIRCDAHFLGEEIKRFAVGGNLQACAEECARYQEGVNNCKSATVVTTTNECILRSTVGDIAQRPYVNTALFLGELPDGSSPTSTSAGCAATPSLTNVLFKETAKTRWGETIHIVGNVPQLGTWDPARSIPLSALNYTESENLWFVNVKLNPGDGIGYKFIRKQADGSVQWESDPDRVYTIPGTCTGSVTRVDVWR